MQMNLVSNQCSKKFIFISIFFVLAVLFLYRPTTSQALYAVHTNDSWTFTVKKAQRNFVYSAGPLNGKLITTGYLLGETKIALNEQFNLKIISVNSNILENVSFQMNSGDETVTAIGSAESFENRIQDALGRSILGEGDFLQNNSALNAGSDIFIAPVNTSWSSLIQNWNESITNLPGALDGLEAVLLLEDSNNEIDYEMRIKYEGTYINSTMGINLDFTYEALIQWEKSTGVLLKYDFHSQMEGTYNNQFSATFFMNLAVERSDINDVLGNSNQGTSGFGLFVILATIGIISKKKKK